MIVFCEKAYYNGKRLGVVWKPEESREAEIEAIAFWEKIKNPVRNGTAYYKSVVKLLRGYEKEAAMRYKWAD